MASIDMANIPDYVKMAITEFNEIMSNSQKDMFENLNRAFKGGLFVLQYLSSQDTAVLPSELSVALNSSTARVSALLGSLEKKGLIVRDIDTTNRRNILVTITESGRNFAKSEMKKRKEHLAQVFTELGEKDAEDFLRLLEKFFELMHKHTEEEDS